jgi:hypothetical protein
MAALSLRKRNWLKSLFNRKPAKPDSRANRIAFKVGARQSKNGSTAALQQAVLMSLRNDARLSK